MLDFSTFCHQWTKSQFPFAVPTANDYRVFVNGREIPVYACRISAYPFNTWWPGHQRPVSQAEGASFVNLISDEEIFITVKPLKKTDYKRVMIKPYAKNVRYEQTSEGISFSLKESGGYVFWLDDYHAPLYLFNNKPSPCANPKAVTHYFGKGVHFPGKITLKSNESVYLDKDALVYGCIFAENAENIRIYGNGVFDDGHEERVSEHCYEPYTNGNLKLYDCKNVTVEGVGFMNSAIWCVNLFHCTDVTLDGVNVFGQWRYNTDGIDIVNCQRIAVKNCFVHSFDDTVTVKGIDRYAFESNADILIENCVLWCDWGKTMEIGLETECADYHNVTFRSCHLLRAANTACDIQNGDCAYVQNITFENISVEIEAFYTEAVYQSSEDQIYDKQDTVEIPFLLSIDNPRFRARYEFLGAGTGNTSALGKPTYASVNGITVKNVTVYCDGAVIQRQEKPVVKILLSNIIPTTEYRNITVENVTLNGKRLSGADMEIVVRGCPEKILTIK